MMRNSRTFRSSLSAIAAASIAGLVHAAPPPAGSPALQVPGGMLDPSQRPRDIYVGTPVAAVPDPNTACTVAERYVKLVDSGRTSELAALYAADGTVYPPTQNIAHGRAEIAAFYAKVGALKPRIIGVAYIGTKRECIAYLAVGTKINGEQRFTMVTVDHFTLNDKGEVSRMIAFSRGPNPNFLLTEGK
jgi:hypothetical protein